MRDGVRRRKAKHLQGYADCLKTASTVCQATRDMHHAVLNSALISTSQLDLEGDVHTMTAMSNANMLKHP
eukprot:366444-Chlamydomonas_euryale.AAC.37